MRVIVKRILDWKRPYLQTLFLIIVIALACAFDLCKIITDACAKAGVKADEMWMPLRFALAYGRIPLSILIVVVLWWIIRKANKNAVINLDTNTYHVHAFFAYQFCRYFWGYKKCRLKLVPIPMQFKLVCSGLFEEYIYNEGIHKAPENDEVKINKRDKDTSTVNFVVSDTYKVEKKQLPDSVLALTTYDFDRSSDDHARYDSDKLVSAVISTVRNLPNTVVKVNVFATTNPMNTYRIAKEAFSTGGRDTVKSLYVFPQDDKNGRNFAEQGMKIY